MTKWIIAYASAAFVFGILDAIWLRWAEANVYRPMIGEIMAKDFNLAAAGVFYVIYLFGMMWFAIRPGLESGNVWSALLNGVLLGGMCYATFDLTSQAVFKVWPTKVTVIDICWGMFATGITSAVATAVTLRFTT